MRSKSLLVLIVIVATLMVFGCSNGELTTDIPRTSAAPALSTSEAVQSAEKIIEELPDSVSGYRALASARIRLGRESGDPDQNQAALDAIKKGYAVAPEDPILRKLEATVFLSDHKFRDARDIGEKLLAASPADPFVLGILTDANAELGDYEVAADYAQKMVDVRPDSTSYARAAHIRALYGDHEGSVELYRLAARTTDPSDREGQAWCLAQLGNELWRNGRYDESLRAYDEALVVFPNYHHALFGKGRTLASKGELSASRDQLVAAKERSAGIDTVLLLGDVYRKLGDEANAAKQYEFAEGGEATMGAHYDEHRMALFWADNDKDLDRALEVALADFAEIKDIYASDILAWCYYKKGAYKEAREQIALAKRLKTRDARIYYHSGMIESALGNRQAALTELRTALEINPVFDIHHAEKAREAIERLSSGGNLL